MTENNRRSSKIVGACKKLKVYLRTFTRSTDAGAVSSRGAPFSTSVVSAHGRERNKEQIQTSSSETSSDAAVLNQLGVSKLKLSLPDEAEPMFRQALLMDPDLNDARSNLGQALRILGRLAEAEQVLQLAILANPRDPVIHGRLAMVFRQSGRSADAERQYREALLLAPEDADTLNNLGTVLNEQEKMAEAERCFRAAIDLDSDHAMARCNLGLILSDRGLQREAEDNFLAALRADPSYFYARISYVMNKLLVIQDSEASGERSRTEYQLALRELQEWLQTADDSAVHAASDVVGWVAPFYLAYQGKNDRELQAMYGSFICEVMARRYPEFAQHPVMPMAPHGKPLRIGIVSAFFADHSNWKTPIRGWIENIDHDRFQIFGYYTGFIVDDATASARRNCHEFVEGIPFEPLAKKIRDDALHVLIFPEIGMDPVTTKLASLRLAPIQCNSWGHPDTSGMPSIDYYLSSALMEPADGQDQYTEKLIRLPNISIHYTPPVYTIPKSARRDFGLRDDMVLYCCAQSLFKYLPQFDFIYPRIAKEVPNAQFVFFSSQKSDDLTAIFTRRIASAFEREGLDATRHVIVMPRMHTGAFQSVIRLCDVYLDSIEWSGCNTTLESLVCDLPVITLGGAMMRGRHTYAFLKMMDFDELIADDLNSYIALAIRFGLDHVMRQRIRSEIPKRMPRVCGDLTCVRALEEFVCAAVSGYQGV